MQKYQGNALTNQGTPAAGASVTVQVQSTLTNATLYSDNGVTAQANPLTADANGFFSFYASNGIYQITISGGGLQSNVVLTNVQLYGVYFGTGSPNSSVIGFVGETYINTNGGATTTFWVKESGAGTNTGWVAK